MNFIDLIILLILGVIFLYSIYLKIRKMFFLNSTVDMQSNDINITSLEKKSRLRCDRRCEFCQYRR